MASVADYKGDFTVVWHRSAHSPRFERIVDRALASEDEDEILHEIDRSPATLGLNEATNPRRRFPLAICVNIPRRGMSAIDPLRRFAAAAIRRR